MLSSNVSSSAGEDEDMQQADTTGQGLGSLGDHSSFAPPALQYESSHAKATLGHQASEPRQDSSAFCSVLKSATSTSASPEVPISQPLQREPIAKQLVATSQPTTAVAALADSDATLPGVFPTATAAMTLEGGGAPAAAAAVHPEVLDARVTMCLAFFQLGIPIDLAELTRAIPNAVGQSQGCVVIHRLRKPTWKAVVTPSGCTRLFTPYEGEIARTAAKQFARLVKKYYSADAAFKNYKIAHVQILAHVAFGLDLDSLAANLTEEQMTLIHQNPTDAMVPRLLPIAKEHGSLKVMVEGVTEGGRKISVLVKQSGSLMVQDAKALREGTRAFDALLPHLARHSIWW